MPKRLTVKDMHIEEDHILVTLAETITGDNLHASGRMLVDSDDLAFIYIVDSNDGYFYLEFKKNVWSVLKDVLARECRVFLVIDEKETLELENFHEELVFLMDNISENPNYGETMLFEVERIFN